MACGSPSTAVSSTTLKCAVLRRTGAPCGGAGRGDRHGCEHRGCAGHVHHASYDPNEPRVIADTARNAVGLTGDAHKAALQLAQQTRVAEQGRQRPVRARRRVKLITCTRRRWMPEPSQSIPAFTAGIHLGGRHPLYCQPQAPWGPERDTGAGKFLQPTSSRSGPGWAGRPSAIILPPSALREPTGIDLPAEPKKSLYYPPPTGWARWSAGLLCLWAERQDLVSGNGGGSLRRGQRGKASAYVVSEIPGPGRQYHWRLSLSANGRCSRQRPARPCGR